MAEESADADDTGGRQRPGGEKYEQDEAKTLCPDRHRTAAGRGNPPGIAEGEQERRRTTAAHGGRGSHHDARDRLRGDRAHDPVLEAIGRSDPITRGERLEFAGDHQRGGQLIVRAVHLQ